MQVVAFLINSKRSKDIEVVLLSELSKELHLSSEFDERNKRGVYKQIQAELRLDSFGN